MNANQNASDTKSCPLPTDYVLICTLNVHRNIKSDIYRQSYVTILVYCSLKQYLTIMILIIITIIIIISSSIIIIVVIIIIWYYRHFCFCLFLTWTVVLWSWNCGEVSSQWLTEKSSWISFTFLHLPACKLFVCTQSRFSSAAGRKSGSLADKKLYKLMFTQRRNWVAVWLIPLSTQKFERWVWKPNVRSFIWSSFFMYCFLCGAGCVVFELTSQIWQTAWKKIELVTLFEPQFFVISRLIYPCACLTVSPGQVVSELTRTSAQRHC